VRRIVKPHPSVSLQPVVVVVVMVVVVVVVVVKKEMREQG
jgi:hypothetical protein